MGQPGSPGTEAAFSQAGFGDVRLPVDLVVGDVRLVARRAWVWRVAEPRGPETIRIVLDGDVDTVIGANRLTARRASLWLRPRGIGGVGDAVGIYEVFGFFERVDSPGGPAGLGFTADELPVQALIAARAPVRMTVDLRSPGRPETGSETDEFVVRSEQAFGEAMIAIRNPGAARGGERGVNEPPLTPPAWILHRRVPGGGDETGVDEGVDAGDEAPGRPADTGVSRANPRAREGGRSIPFSPEREAAERGVRRPPEPPVVDELHPTPSDPLRDGTRVAERGAGTADAEPESGVADQTDQTDRSEPSRAIRAAGGTEDTGEPGSTEPKIDRIFSSTGVFFFSAGDRVVREASSDDEYAWILTGGVTVQYEGVDRVVEMTARRAVMFQSREAGGATLGDASASDVVGVYLEGGVRVSDGEYTLRSPRVYYDVRADRALLIDAVFRTYNEALRMPLTLRADVIRQEAAGTFSAEKATYANTGFATPHLSIGTSKMTITERQRPGGETSRLVEAEHVTLRGGGVPFFWWPWFKGDPERFPLRSVGLTDSNRTGTVFQTSWDPFTLLGIDPPGGLSGTVDLDYYADRGFGLGTGLDWQTERMQGGLFAYLLPDDDGKDVLRNASEIDRRGEFRGVVALKHRWQFRPEWTAWLNGFHASDEAVLPALFRDMTEVSGELTTRGYLRRLENDTLITLEAKVATTDFVPNDHAAQSPGYQVDKLPEVAFAKIGDDLLDEWAPGWLTHTWHAEASRMRLRFAEITPADLGLRSRGQSLRGFGIEPGDSIGDASRAVGLDESFVTRLDTRHELSTKFNAGPVHVNPFVVGRATAYDTSFEGFSPNESDEIRLWGSAGVNVSTSIFRVDDSISSRTFDLHRMRHVIEPGVTLWHAGSTIDEADLPVYDDDVESLAAGTGVRAGVNQTWQTKRGAPGRWRNVDVFTFDAEYVWFSGEVNERMPTGRFYPSRPELSTPDEYVRLAGAWQVSEVVGLTGETIWDVGDRREDRNAVGVFVQHSERLMTLVEVRRLEAQGDTYGDGVLRGTFGEKYVYVLTGTYNFRLDDFQAFTLMLLRRFPNGLLGGQLTYDNISGETTFGFYVQPTGLRGFGGGGDGSRF